MWVQMRGVSRQPRWENLTIKTHRMATAELPKFAVRHAWCCCGGAPQKQNVSQPCAAVDGQHGMQLCASICIAALRPHHAAAGPVSETF